MRVTPPPSRGDRIASRDDGCSAVQGIQRIRPVGTGAGKFFARSVPDDRQFAEYGAAADRRPRISNFVSKKLCVLEIDLEIVEALPDKADKRKVELVSNSPEFFASGCKTPPRNAFRQLIRAMLCCLLVFLLVSTDRDRPTVALQRRDANSVGDQSISTPSPRPSCFSPEHTPSAHLHVTLLRATRKCWCYPPVSADADNGRRPQIASAWFEIAASLTDEAAQTTAGRNPSLPGTPNARPHPPRRRLTTTRQKLRAT